MTDSVWTIAKDTETNKSYLLYFDENIKEFKVYKEINIPSNITNYAIYTTTEWINDNIHLFGQAIVDGVSKAIHIQLSR